MNMLKYPVRHHYREGSFTERKTTSRWKEYGSVDATIVHHGIINVGRYDQATTAAQIGQVAPPLTTVLLPLAPTSTEVQHDALIWQERLNPRKEFYGTVDWGKAAGVVL
jgi:hypothetical protein